MNDIQILEDMRDEINGYLWEEDDYQMSTQAQQQFDALNWAIKELKNRDNYISEQVIRDKEVKMDKVELHKQICDSLNKLYEDKNHDYGDSVHDTFEKYGLTSFLVRMEDKLNRARTLDKVEGKVKDEKIEDTLLDLANYAILAVIELKCKDGKNKDENL